MVVGESRLCRKNNRFAWNSNSERIRASSEALECDDRSGNPGGFILVGQCGSFHDGYQTKKGIFKSFDLSFKLRTDSVFKFPKKLRHKLYLQLVRSAGYLSIHFLLTTSRIWRMAISWCAVLKENMEYRRLRMLMRALQLPLPRIDGGNPLMQVLQKKLHREISAVLPPQVLLGQWP